MGISLSGLTQSSTGNLTLSAGSGNDVLIGNGSTQIFIDGGTDTLGIGGTAVSGSRLNLETGAVALDFITSTGTAINVVADTVNDTSGAATLAIVPTVQIGAMTYTSTNSMTYTDTASLYIAGIPVASTNVTFTNAAYALWVDAGAVRFDDRTFWIGGIAYEFPADNGNANEMLLTDGSGNLSWSSVSSASVATTVTVTDNESTNENNLIPFVADAATATGSHGLEMDGDFHYSPNTGRLTATQLSGTLQTAAQGLVTSLGTLTSLGLTGDVSINGAALVFTGNTTTVGSEYSIQQDAAGVDHLQFNVPSSKGFKFSINAVEDLIWTTGALAFQQATTLSTTAGNLTLSAATGADVLIGDNVVLLQIDGGADSITANGTFFQANGTGMVIGHTAKLTTGAAFELQIIGDGQADSGMSLARFGSTSGAELAFVSGPGSLGATTIVADNQQLGELRFYAPDGSDLSTLVAEFGAEVDDSSPGTGDIGAAFYWKLEKGGTEIRELMRLTADGQFLLGHNAPLRVSTGDGSSSADPHFQRVGTAGDNSKTLLASFSTTATMAAAPQLSFAKGGASTVAVGTVVTDDEILGEIIAFGDDGTDLKSPAAAIEFAVDGTPGTGDMPGRMVFYTTTDAGETLSERMRINATGDVNIGTTSNYRLHVRSTVANRGIKVDTATSTHVAQVLIENAVANAANHAELKFSLGASSGDGRIIWDTADNPIWTMGVKNSDNSFRFQSTAGAGLDTPDLTITAAGNVLIGPTSEVTFGNPSDSRLQVHGTANDTSSVQIGRWSSNDDPPRLGFVKSRGSIGAYTAVANNDRLGDIEWYAADGTDANTIGAKIAAWVDDASVAGSQVGTELVFYTAAGATNDDLAARLTISPAGPVGILTAPEANVALTVKALADAAAVKVLGTNGNMAAQIGVTNADEGYLDLADGGTTKVRIAASMSSYFNGGNVGIGAAPNGGANYPFQIYRSSSDVTYMNISNAATGQGGDGSDGLDIGINSSGHAHILQRENLDLYLSTNGITRITVKNDGEIDIPTGGLTVTKTGTSVPIVLHLKNLQAKANDVGPGIYFTGHTSGQSMGYIMARWAQELSAADTTAMSFWTRNTSNSLDPRMSISGNGNVGIGADMTPDYKLDVQGTGRFDSTLSVGGKVGIGNANFPAGGMLRVQGQAPTSAGHYPTHLYVDGAVTAVANNSDLSGTYFDGINYAGSAARTIGRLDTVFIAAPPTDGTDVTTAANHRSNLRIYTASGVTAGTVPLYIQNAQAAHSPAIVLHSDNSSGYRSQIQFKNNYSVGEHVASSIEGSGYLQFYVSNGSNVADVKALELASTTGNALFGGSVLIGASTSGLSATPKLQLEANALTAIDHTLFLRNDGTSSTLAGTGTAIDFQAGDANAGPSQTGYVYSYITTESFDGVNQFVALRAGNTTPTTSNGHLIVKADGTVTVGNLQILKASNATLQIQESGAESWTFVGAGSGLYLKRDGTNQIGFFQDGDLYVYGHIKMQSSKGIYDVGGSGNQWTTNALALSNANAGGENLITVTNTSTTASSRAILQALVPVTDNSTVDPMVVLGVSAQWYWRMGADNSESDRFAISSNGFLGTDDVLRVTTGKAISFFTDTFVSYDYVCDGCGKASLETFICCGIVAWHDDVLALREMNLNDKGIQHMTKLGILEVDGPDTSDPGASFINYQKAQHFTWAGMWQNRQRMDAQYDEHESRFGNKIRKLETILKKMLGEKEYTLLMDQID